jgi:hypothetical protein
MANYEYTAHLIQNKGKMVYEYNPLLNYRSKDGGGVIGDMTTSGTSGLNFDLEHPVEIACQQSYDGSVNLILNDAKNQPRLINTRFTPKENNTYERVDRLGNTDTNLYDEKEFEIDTSLLKKYINIPKVKFSGVFYGGSLPVGNYTFYFKLSDADDNETDIVAESGLVTIHMGALNTPSAIRGGQYNENSGKLVQFLLSGIDSGYDYVTVYYSRATGADNNQRTVTATKVLNRFRVRQGTCNVTITGNEESTAIPTTDLSQDFFLPSSAKTQAICQNMLFLGNVEKYTPPYEELSKVSLGFVPYYETKTEKEAFGSELTYQYSGTDYYNVHNIYNKVGYWNEEIYRFGIVYILSNGALSPVYNVRGRDKVPQFSTAETYSDYKNLSIDYDTQMISSATLENSAGVCRIKDDDNSKTYLQVRNFKFIPQEGVIDALKDLQVKGYFFVRQKRIPTILCQAFMIGQDSFSGIPAWRTGDGSKPLYVTETFLDSQGYLTHDYDSRLIEVDSGKFKANVALCPEYELNQAYYNNLFTGSKMTIKQVTKGDYLHGELNHFYTNSADYNVADTQYTQAKVISVPDSGIVRDGNTLFKNTAGGPSDIKFAYICNKTNKPVKDNFSTLKVKWIFTRGNLMHTTANWYTSENKVRIARGLYGTYLGVYKNDRIETNSLINIYIPGFDAGQMSEYFKIRINCEDPYYAVTDRKNLSELTEAGEEIFRGDCYISQFTHRLNRNFQDPDAPNNDTIIEPDSWRENYDSNKETESEVNRGDVNAVRLGTYITFKCYTSYNVGMRDWDSSYPSEEALTGSKRSFYPLCPIRTDGNYKIPESSAYNQGFSATTGEKTNFLQPAIPYIKNCFQTRVAYSDVGQTDAFKNGLRIFKGISYVDYNNQHGGIMKLVEWQGNLIIIFEHAIALASVNQNALIPTDDGTKISVGAIKPLTSTPVMISTDIGTQWPESICCSQSYIYGVDTVAKKIWRTDGKSLELISDFKVQKFLNDNITLGERELTPLIGIRNVKTHYNAFKRDIMFTYYDDYKGLEEVAWNLCYNELQKTFVTFYSWIPSYSANIDNVFFSFDRNTSKWEALFNNKKGVYCEYVYAKDENGKETSEKVSNLRKLKLGTDTEYTNVKYIYTLNRDSFGFYKHCTITGDTLSIADSAWDLIKIKENEPLIPGVVLNISCTVCDANNAGNLYGTYTNNICVQKVDSTFKLTNDFWKHGEAGLIDVQEKRKPCFWYGKQHPFEFEFVTGNDNAGYKQFDNLIISSNNVAPESIHYTIIGDSYDFVDQKQAMYFRQEATKALYQYNGANLIFDRRVLDGTTGYLPEMVTSSKYIEKDAAGNYLRKNEAVSSIYKDSLFTLIYARQDSFNEVEDYYRQIVATKNYSDYPNITGCELYWEPSLNQFSLCNHVKGRDVKEVGRTRGNMQYSNDKWYIQITPINIINRNGTWVKKTNDNNEQFWLPKLILNNIPDEVWDHKSGLENNDFPEDLGNTTSNKYILSKNGLRYTIDDLDGGDWNTLATSRKEIKLMDNYIKTRIRYKGDKLAIILAIVTQYNTIA